MRTPYASGREIYVQKFGNAYQRKEIDRRMPLFYCTFTSKFIKHSAKWNIFRKPCALSFHTLVYVPWSFASCFVWDVSRPRTVFFLRTLYVSLPWFCAQLDFWCAIYAEVCVTRPLCGGLTSQSVRCGHFLHISARYWMARAIKSFSIIKSDFVKRVMCILEWSDVDVARPCPGANKPQPKPL